MLSKLFLIIIASLLACSQNTSTFLKPGSRTLLDAHNCYPNHGRWTDRIERALSCNFPIAIEQDLVWYTDSLTGKSWSIVSHGEPYLGMNPLCACTFLSELDR